MHIPVRLFKKGGEGTYEVPLEADIIQWLKEKGEWVEKEEELCVLEADKGAFSLVSPVSGMIAVIHYPEGTIWKRGVSEMVGDTLYYDPPLCTIEDEKTVRARVSDSARSLKIADASPDAAEKLPEISQSKKPKIRISAGAIKLITEHMLSFEEIHARFPEEKELREELVLQFLESKKEKSNRDVCAVVPRARVRAQELGVALENVRGSGPDGLILVSDVEAADAGPAHARVQIPEDEEAVVLQIPALWRTVGRNVTEGSHIPTASADAGFKFDFGPLLEFHLKYREMFPYASWFPIMAALVHTLAREEFIILNSFWQEEVSVNDVGGTSPAAIVARRRVHMGIAYDRGELPKIDWNAKKLYGDRLKILVLHDADKKSISELIASTEELLRKADEKKLSLNDLLGFTYIFNNIGALGLKEGGSIMAGKISSMANLGKLDFARREGSLQIFFDHRMIDGALVARFIKAVHKEMVGSIIPELETFFLKK